MKRYQQTMAILIFAVSPVIFLYSHNVELVNFSEIIVPIIFSVAISVIAYLCLLLILKNIGKTALATIFFLIIFFSYGHIFNLVPDWKIAGLSLDSHRCLLPMVSIFYIIIFVFIWRAHYTPDNIIKIVSVVGITLIVMSLFNIGRYLLTKDNQETDSEGGLNKALVVDNGQNLTRDIYYIILDGYVSSKTLQEVYNFDNNEFTEYLQQKGFYIADDSRSNYANTFLSLASSLNGSFLENQVDSTVTENKDRGPMYKMIREGAVMRSMQSAGYQYITFSSGWGATDHNKDADYEIHCSRGSEFLSVLTQTTILLPFQEFLIGDDSRQRILCGFDELANIPKRSEPTFTFAHLVVPHPPYLFDEEGHPVSSDELQMSGHVWEDKASYLKQLVFVNHKVITLVDGLITESVTPPIIILQADHGTAVGFSQNGGAGWQDPTDSMLKERFSIFNAYYLPDDGSSVLYSQVTPVNTFRIIFNKYFKTEYNLLKDRSYYSSYDLPYQLVEVTDRLK